jgi:hypothetical protein
MYSDLILRSRARFARRLEGWPRRTDSQPSFETRAWTTLMRRPCAAPQDEVRDRFTRSDEQFLRRCIDVARPRRQPVGWVELLRNPSLASDVSMGSLRSTHPTGSAAAIAPADSADSTFHLEQSICGASNRSRVAFRRQAARRSFSKSLRNKRVWLSTA